MKKTFFLVIVLCLSLSLSFAVFAADEWAPFEPASGSDLMTCVVAGKITPDQATVNALGDITEQDWAIGPADAAMTILEYADFQCPHCSRVGISLLQFQKNHPDSVRYVYRHFPLSFHEKAPAAAYAADAAGKQGFFFDVEDYLYLNQNVWSGLGSVDEFIVWLKENIPANIKGLDYDQWLKDFENADLRANIDGQLDKVGQTGKVQGTPTIFLNFNKYESGIDEATLSKWLDIFAFQSAKLYDKCPPVVVDPSKQYRAIVDTSAGEIMINLFADKAPMAVNSFVYLASQGWYDGVSFYNVVPGYLAQTGDASGTGTKYGNSGYQYANEKSDLSFSEKGMVATNNPATDKNSAQFFITYDFSAYYRNKFATEPETANLAKDVIETRIQEKIDAFSARYTVFGQVSADSYAIFEKISQVDKINAIKIEMK